MKATGIVRPVDQLGRIVIPCELRKSLEIDCGSLVEIFVDGDSIILQKYERTCALCGSKNDLIPHHTRWICTACRDEIIKNKSLG